MAKQRLFPEPQRADESGSRQNFEQIASKIFTVPKEEIDRREKNWERDRKRPKRA